MNVLDLGTPSPGKFTSSHLSRKRVHKPKSKSELKVPQRVIDQVEGSKAEIVDAMKLILTGKPLSHSYEWYYKSIETLCRFRPMEQSYLLQELFKRLKHHYYNEVNPGITAAMAQVETQASRDDYISASTDYLQIFSKWLDILKKLTKIFLYLDRSYLKQHPSKKMIHEFGLTMLVDDLLSANRDEDYGMEVDEEAGGENSDKTSNSSSVSSSKLSTPVVSLSPPALHSHMSNLFKIANELLRTTREEMFIGSTYTAAQKLISNLVTLNFNNQIRLKDIWLDKLLIHHSRLAKNCLSIPLEYYESCERYISREISFMKECGESLPMRQEFTNKVIWIWIFKNVNSVLKMILPYIIGSKELTSIYRLCVDAEELYKISACQTLYYEWGQFVYNDVESILLKDKNLYNKSSGNVNISIISQVVCEIGKYQSIYKMNPELNIKFEFELRNAISRVLNSPQLNGFIINQLCKHCDLYFKKPSIIENETILTSLPTEDILSVFKLITNKRAFLSMYKRDLSRRLLFNKSQFLERETELVELMCAIVGDDDEGLTAMLNDINLKSDTTSTRTTPDGIEFTPLILGAKHWPEFPKSMAAELILPSILQDKIDIFADQYKTDRNKNRKLDWSFYAFHQLVITGNFPLGAKELVVNLLQAAIVMLFNEEDVDQLNAEQVAEKLGADKKLIMNGLGSLSTEKYTILKKSGPYYSFNNEFTDKAQRIKIPLVKAAKEVQNKEQLEMDTKQISRERTHEYRAIIVKTMKELKEIAHNDLLTIIVPKLEQTGPFLIAELKTNIEFLIDNEFVKRKDGNILVYIP